MKMFYGNTPVKSLNIKHYEVSTNDATLKASDMQAGITAYAKGRKVVGTGKSFEFAQYGTFETNQQIYVPNDINVIEISSTLYPVQHTIALSEMKNQDFSVALPVCKASIDNVMYDITVTVVNHLMLLSCDESIKLEVFYGKDNYT